jgi:hypothetical protein
VAGSDPGGLESDNHDVYFRGRYGRVKKKASNRPLARLKGRNWGLDGEDRVYGRPFDFAQGRQLKVESASPGEESPHASRKQQGSDTEN